MKLIRFGEVGSEKPGLQLEDGRRVDASAFGQDYNEAFFASGGLDKLRAWAKVNATQAPVIEPGTRLAPPIARPSKLICVGLNYSDHAAETGASVPAEPMIFGKATSAIVGPNDDLVIPKGSSQTDWEVELAIVIGKRASYVSREQAMAYVAGYVLHNDYSERHFQKDRGGQFIKGKSCDTFAPMGPFLATADEIPDPQKLNMWLKVNGQIMQNGSTANMVFGVIELVSHLSQFMSLLPGDVISTGTPAGVGLGMKPPVFLKPGDRIELGIDGLGSSAQAAVAYKG